MSEVHVHRFHFKINDLGIKYRLNNIRTIMGIKSEDQKMGIPIKNYRLLVIPGHLYAPNIKTCKLLERRRREINPVGTASRAEIANGDIYGLAFV